MSATGSSLSKNLTTNVMETTPTCEAGKVSRRKSRRLQRIGILFSDKRKSSNESIPRWGSNVVRNAMERCRCVVNRPVIIDGGEKEGRKRRGKKQGMEGGVEDC